MGSKRIATAAVGVVLAVVLAGCSDDPDPNTSGDPTSSSTASNPSTSPVTEESTEPVEPSLPADAEEATKAGAEAFVGYYWEVINYAQATGDTRLYGDLSADTCGQCQASIDLTADIYDKGGVVRGGDYAIDIVGMTELSTPSGDDLSYGVELKATNSRGVVVLPGERRRRILPSTVDLKFVVHWTVDRRWRVDVWERA